MEFRPDGTLTYATRHERREGVISLTYRIEPGVLVTDQPSHPMVHRTRYWFSDDGRMVLEDRGRQLRYVRQALAARRPERRR